MNLRLRILISKIIGIIISIFFLSHMISIAFGLVLMSEGADSSWFTLFYGLVPIVTFTIFFNFINFLRLSNDNFLQIKKYLKYSSFSLIFLSLSLYIYSLFNYEFLSFFAVIPLIPSIVYYLIIFLIKGGISNNNHK